jgi:hypothetical protein
LDEAINAKVISTAARRIRHESQRSFEIEARLAYVADKTLLYLPEILKVQVQELFPVRTPGGWHPRIHGEAADDEVLMRVALSDLPCSSHRFLYALSIRQAQNAASDSKTEQMLNDRFPWSNRRARGASRI